MSFQTKVNRDWAPGVEGSFASSNPMTLYVAGPGGLVSGANGVRVGRFAFASYIELGGTALRADNNIALLNGGLTPATALMFIANEQQGINTVYLSEAGMTTLPFQNIEGFTRGDFWVRSTAAVTRGMKVYASTDDGHAVAASAAPAGNFIATNFVALSECAAGEIFKMGYGN